MSAGAIQQMLGSTYSACMLSSEGRRSEDRRYSRNGACYQQIPESVSRRLDQLVVERYSADFREHLFSLDAKVRGRASDAPGWLVVRMYLDQLIGGRYLAEQSGVRGPEVRGPVTL